MSDHKWSPNIIAAAVGAFGVFGASLVSAWAAIFGHSKSSKSDTASAMAAQQQVLNDSFELFMEEARERIRGLEGEVRQLRQYNLSLIELLRKHGIDVPKPNFDSALLMFTSNGQARDEASEQTVAALPAPKGPSR